MSLELNEVDAILAAEKTLVSGLDWTEEGPNAKLNSPLIDASGIIIGGLRFQATVQIHRSIQSGSAVLILEGSPFQRMTYKPGHAHVNTNAYPVPASLRFRTLPAGRSRIHKWAHNRAWPIKDNLGAGDLIDPEPEAYMDALQLFLEACGIDAYVPDPPHRPVLEF